MTENNELICSDAFRKAMEGLSTCLHKFFLLRETDLGILLLELLTYSPIKRISISKTNISVLLLSEPLDPSYFLFAETFIPLHRQHMLLI